MHLALDFKNNDLILKDGGGVERVKDGRFVVQQCRSRLRAMRGEWLLDPLLGLISIDDFGKQYSLFDIEMSARRIILTTQGVLSIEDLNASIDKVTRKLTITFEAKTIYGKIETTIPWE